MKLYKKVEGRFYVAGESANIKTRIVS